MILNLIGGGGSGAELNFKVVGGTSQPSNPSENTIWVNTSTAITSWYFTSEQPTSPASGDVWFSISTASGAAFNALKENNLTVYPVSAKQYVKSAWSGSWKDVTAKIYQNGSWKEWAMTIVPNTQLTWSAGGQSEASIQKNDATGVVVYCTACAGESSYGMTQIEIRDRKTLHLETTLTIDYDGGTPNTVYVGIFNGTTFVTGATFSAEQDGTISKDYDISALANGTYYFGVFFESNSSSRYRKYCAITKATLM